MLGQKSRPEIRRKTSDGRLIFWPTRPGQRRVCELEIGHLEIVDLPMKNRDVPQQTVGLPEGLLVNSPMWGSHFFSPKTIEKTIEKTIGIRVDQLVTRGSPVSKAKIVLDQRREFH
jgi:hypothetical protein